MPGPAREWFSAAELADLGLPDVPGIKANVLLMAKREGWCRAEWEGTRWRKRQARGGGVEFHIFVLPRTAQIKLAFDASRAPPPAEVAAKAALSRSEMWRWFDRLPQAKRDEAARRLQALDAVDALVRAGVRKVFAAQEVARTASVALSGLYRWEAMVAGVERADRLPYLAPRHTGRVTAGECTPDAWECLKADYLRPEKPNFSDCYDRLQQIAPSRGWTVPSRTTLSRRIDALPPQAVTLARDGVDALKRMYPAQQRDRGIFHALEAVNADFHTWDVFVRWPADHSGRVVIARPEMVAFQDLYSDMILAWRVSQSPNKETVQLALGDVVEQYGIPDQCVFDNGREFASKWITGGIPNRYRFKVREGEPDGLLKQLGVEVHWATPYSGQSKPIERAFRDFAQGLAKHPAFAGAYTGNNPLAKPENYGNAAVPLDLFMRVVGEGIAHHNAKPGRHKPHVGQLPHVCAGKLSFAEAFAASYRDAPIRRATPEQQRLWLLAAEALRVDRRDGTIDLAGNRFWSDILLPFRGQTVVARFDPNALQEPLHVYRTDGGYLGVVQCTQAAGFLDVEAARAHGRARRKWMRATREQLDAELTMSIADVAALLPAAETPAPMPEPKVVRPVFATAGNAALAARAHPDDEEIPEGDALLLRFAAMRRADRLRIVRDDDD